MKGTELLVARCCVDLLFHVYLDLHIHISMLIHICISMYLYIHISPPQSIFPSCVFRLVVVAFLYLMA